MQAHTNTTRQPHDWSTNNFSMLRCTKWITNWFSFKWKRRRKINNTIACVYPFVFVCVDVVWFTDFVFTWISFFFFYFRIFHANNESEKYEEN